MAVSLVKRHEIFAHGQEVIVYPAWSLASDDLSDMIDNGEPAMIEENLWNGKIAVRYLGSDDVITVDVATVSDPYGEPCRCRD